MSYIHLDENEKMTSVKIWYSLQFVRNVKIFPIKASSILTFITRDIITRTLLATDYMDIHVDVAKCLCVIKCG